MIRKASNLVPYFVLALALTVFFVWLKAEDTSSTNDVIERMTQLTEEWKKGGETGVVRSTPLMVDMRSSAEFEISHCEGAINVPHEKIKEAIFFLVLDRKTPLFVYSRSMRISGRAVEYFKGMGYDVVHNLNEMDEQQSLREKERERLDAPKGRK